MAFSTSSKPLSVPIFCSSISVLVQEEDEEEKEEEAV